MEGNYIRLIWYIHIHNIYIYVCIWLGNHHKHCRSPTRRFSLAPPFWPAPDDGTLIQSDFKLTDFLRKNYMSIMDGPNFMFDMIYSHITIWTFNHQKNDMLLSWIKACRQCRRSGNQTWQWTIVRLFQCVFPLKCQCCSWISQLAVPDVQRATIPSPYVYI